MIISKGAKKGQLIALTIILFVFGLLAIGSVTVNNINYLYIILLGFLLFFPVYLYSLSFYDIYIDNNFFIISNLIRTKKILISEFVAIVPAKRVLATLNSPYLTVLFKNNRRFNFIKERPVNGILVKDRNVISNELTQAINEYILISKRKG